MADGLLMAANRGDDLVHIAAIVPAHNAGLTLEACLQALTAQVLRPDTIIVFDDASTDDTAAIAIRCGARVIPHRGMPIGPARGRNQAAAMVEAECLFFVDADVVLAPDALANLMSALEQYQAVAAFGSYDEHPRSKRLSSIYANLRHHFIHQNGAREAATFWSGIGLIRRDPFLALHGFNADLFPVPSIEDVELGSRLVAAGYAIRLVPEARGSHWKDWRLLRLWYADIVRRAYPWSALIAEGRAASNALNLSNGERLRALLANATGLTLVLGLWKPVLLLAALLLFGTYACANARFLALVKSHYGLKAAAASAVLHCCYHIYATATFVLVVLATRLGLRRRHPSRSRSFPQGSLS